jgi:LuxR family quorum sensing-dependent transcriptional regulator
MKLEEIIGDIEAAEDLEELTLTLQRVIEDYGFAAFAFVDTGHPHLDIPFYFATTGEAWEHEYLRNQFQHVDPCIQRARRTNTPFTWGSVPLPVYTGGRKPGAIKTMEAAHDHGFTEGLVVPYHYVDGKARVYSSLVVFHWKDKVQRFKFLMSGKKYELHLVMIYWMQRAIDLIATDIRLKQPIFRVNGPKEVRLLTDRERDVLSWAARGKTIGETADILRISEQTAEGYIRNALAKLNAANKTHAVAKGIHLGLIDV